VAAGKKLNGPGFKKKIHCMKIEHLAIWTCRLEALKHFYSHYFGGVASEKYLNPKKQFSSYFLSFAGGARLELMEKPGIPANLNDPLEQYQGLIHFAFSAGSPAAVDQLSEKLKADGFAVIGEPRWTGDGYYESVILDPDGNRVEIMA
jgi:lactoylglutathione lyase